MKRIVRRCVPVGIAALGLAGGFALVSIPAAQARAQEQELTSKALIDRAEIQDLITRYYYNFGRANPEDFMDFYAEDAELILGNTHFKGKDGIEKAYGRGPGNSRRTPSPMQKAYAFNVLITNPLIVVHGNTATSELIFTEYLTDKQGDVPHVRTIGREYGTFVKVHGQWRYKTRQIMGGTEPPADWKQ